MTTEEKFSIVKGIISEHNSVLGHPPAEVSFEEFVRLIKIMGGTSEDRLKRFSYEDILSCLPSPGPLDNGVKPVVLAKDIAAVFRDRGSSKEDTSKPHVGGKKAERMTLEELVRAFDPEDPSNAVGRRLKSVSKKEKFIVFESGRTVNIEATTKLLNEIKTGYPGRDRYTAGDGDVRPVYRVGELPDNYADENPLWPDRALRPDGTCDQYSRSWEGIPLEVRQLIYLAVKCKEFEVNVENANNIIDIALRPEAAAAIRTRYPGAAIKFGELSRLGGLPKLKIPLAAGKSKPGSFRDGKRVILG